MTPEFEQALHEYAESLKVLDDAVTAFDLAHTAMSVCAQRADVLAGDTPNGTKFTVNNREFVVDVNDGEVTVNPVYPWVEELEEDPTTIAEGV